jgi:hypothetical protein
MVVRAERVALVTLAAALLLATSAVASVSPVIFQINASNVNGSTSFSVSSANLVPDPATGGQKWILPAAQVLQSGPTNIIGTLNSATLRVVDNVLNTPRVLLNFEVLGGDLNATFTVTSAQVSFPTLPASQTTARFTCGTTLTDYNDGVAAVLQGLGAPVGPGIFTADYNGFVPGGVQFANLITGLTTTGGGTVTANDKKPATGFQALGVNLTDISTMSAFTLTAADLMSGQSNFFVTPEPASVGLLLTALCLVRRSR